MTKKRDYYEVLDLDRTVSGEEVKRAYRKLAVKVHPDKNPDDPHAEEKFKELGEAYDVLIDPEKRAAYDRFGHAAFAQGYRAAADSTIHSIFSAKCSAAAERRNFRKIFRRRRRGRSESRQRGSDLRYDMQITLEEAAFGVEKEIEVRKFDACEKCHGSGAEPVRARSIVRRAAVAVRSLVLADFSRSRKPVRVVTARGRLSRNHVAPAMARAASIVPAALN